MLAIGAFTLAGCRGMPTSGEKQARHDFGAVAGQYRPGNQPSGVAGIDAGFEPEQFSRVSRS